MYNAGTPFPKVKSIALANHVSKTSAFSFFPLIMFEGVGAVVNSQWNGVFRVCFPVF